MSSNAVENLAYRVISPSNPHPEALPVVLLHGLMGFSANWGKIWPALTSRPVLVYDQRGHGKSFKPSIGYSPTDYSNDLLSIVNHLQWNRVHVVGHSMGGRVALRFASRFPERTKSLTMEDSGVLARPERLSWILSLLNKIPTPFPDRESAKKFFDLNFTSEAITGSFLHANLEQKENGSIDWRFYKDGMIETIQKGRTQSAWEEFSKLQLPVLLFRGSKSMEFPEDEALQMSSAFSHVQLVTIENAGHYVHAEKPQEFALHLNHFLESTDKT